MFSLCILACAIRRQPPVHILTKEQNNQLDLHLNENADGEWPCTSCSKVFACRSALRLHAIRIHLSVRKQMWECDKCDMVFAHRQSKQHHQKLHTRSLDSIVKCPQCDKTFPGRSYLNKHLRVVHFVIEPVQCPECGKTFSNPIRLKTHQNQVHVEATFQCDICQQMYRTKRYLVHHIKFVHIKNRNYVCDACGASFYDVNAFKKHQNRSCVFVDNISYAKRKKMFARYGQTFDCTLCHRQYCNIQMIRKHYQQCHDRAVVNATICMACNTIFGTTDALVAHKSEPREQLRCGQCRASLKCLKAKEMHMRQHARQGEKFVCPVCKKVLISKAVLDVHMRRIHLGLKPFDCDECDNRFFERTQLMNHKKTHEKQKMRIVCG